MLASLSEWSIWLVPAMLGFIPLYGYWKKVPVFETFVEGAEEGLRLAWRILPYSLAIFVAVGIFRASGAFLMLTTSLRSLLESTGIPGAVIPLMLVRPLSGNASLALLADVLRTHGPDSLAGRLASTVQGSTDTTFYILSIYFGSVGIRKFRYALPVGLLGDLAGMVSSVIICRLFFG